jgi:HAE1 family hydrophobic/amphiphilic exporter-1
MGVREAALKGASQIINAIIASTLTTICVFFPMFFVTGMIMDVFMDMVWVMIFSLFASLVTAVMFLPAIVSSFKIGEVGYKQKTGVFVSVGNFFRRVDASIGKFMSGPRNFIVSNYNKALGASVRFKWLTLLTVFVLLGGSIGLIFINGFIMMPAMDTGTFGISVKINGDFNNSAYYDCGTQKGLAEFLAGELNGRVRENLGGDVDSISSTYTTGGSILSILSGGGATLDLSVLLKENSKISTEKAGQDSYKAVMEYLEGDNPEGNVYIPSGSQAIENSVHFISGVSISASMTSLGADSVVVTLSAQNQQDLEVALEYVWDGIETNIGSARGILKIENSFSNFVVTHVNKRIVASLTVSIKNDANISKIQSLVDAEMKRLFAANAPELAGITQVEDGFAAQFEETYTQMGLALFVAVLLVYLVMVAMFQSFLMPFIVLITVPLAFTGGFILLAVFGMPISVAAIIGFLILMGVITNNGIVMIDYINKARGDGLSVREAVIAGANVRARPILMTMLTTVFAMIPLALGMGASGGVMQPLAVVSIGGLLYATFMSLFAVPAFYSIFVRDKKLIKEVKADEKDNSCKLENEQDEGTSAPVL